MRKIIAGWLAGIWLCLLLVRLPVQAANLAEPIQAQAYVLMEQESGTVLAEAQADVPLPMGMMAKLMTVLLAAEQLESGAWTLETVLTASDVVNTCEGATVWLTAGETMTVVESGDYRECQRCRSRSGGGRERQCSGICDGDERPCI